MGGFGGGGGGIDPRALGYHRGAWGVIPFAIGKVCVAATATYNLWPDTGSPYAQVRVTGMYGIMTGAGAAADTVQLQDKNSNGITEIVNVSALSANDKWDASVIDRTYYDILGGDNIKIVTVSGALTEVWVEFVMINPEDEPST